MSHAHAPCGVLLCMPACGAPNHLPPPVLTLPPSSILPPTLNGQADAPLQLQVQGSPHHLTPPSPPTSVPPPRTLFQPCSGQDGQADSPL